MYKLLLISMLLVVLTLLQALQVDEEMAIHTLFQGKYAVNRAAHAAAQQVDEGALSLGELRIDETAAAAEAARYLGYNLRLDASGDPLPGSFLQDKVEMLVFQVVNGNQTFPYRYRSDAYNYEVTLNGPGVVMIVRLSYPRAFSVLDPIQWEVKGAAELKLG